MMNADFKNNNDDVWPSSRTTISDLTPDAGNGCRLVGLVIAKQDPRLVNSKRELGSTVSVLGFTLRDSIHDTINVASWGSQRHVAVQAGLFHIGDVVILEGFQVIVKQAAETEDNFRPACSSGFSIKLSESHGCLTLYSGGDCDRFRQLQSVMPPLVPRLTPISQVTCSTAANQQGTFSFLVAVTKVGAVREITTRQGRQTQSREIRLMDQSSANFALHLWDTELVQLANTFQAFSTILLVLQCRVRYDNFRQCTVASSTGQTVIVAEPSHATAEVLRQHVNKHRAQHSIDQQTFTPDSVKEQCTVRQLAEKAVLMTAADTSTCVIVHAFITWLHNQDRYKVTKCGKCGRFVPDSESGCVSSECSGMGGQLQEDFSMKLDIADHTGGISSLLLQANTAQQILGVNLREFEEMVEDEREQLNQKWQMEMAKIWVRYLLRTNGKPLFKILHMERLA